MQELVCCFDAMAEDELEKNGGGWPEDQYRRGQVDVCCQQLAARKEQ